MLVTKTADLERLVKELSAADAYALDTEFHAERCYYPKLALVQLAVPGRVAVVDATTVDLQALAPLIAGPAMAVTHACGWDLDIVERACGVRPARVFDTQIAAGFLGYSTPSLGVLVSAFLDRRLDKGQTMSDWFKRPLTPEQIAYAEADVAHLLELRAELERRLVELGRLEWALEECRRATTARPVDDDIVWWRLKGSGRLTGPARARAQELAAWRAQKARTADRPPSAVLPDDVVVSLADRPPRTPADIPASRLFDPRKLPRDTVDELFAALGRGSKLASDRLRIPPDRLPVHLQGVAALIAAWIQQQSRSLSIDPALLASRRDIEACLQNEADCRFRDGWRAELVGDTVDRITRGRTALAFDGRDRLVLVDLQA